MSRFRPRAAINRNMLIMLRRLRGESYASIGKTMGITGARVHQIVKDFNPDALFQTKPQSITPQSPVTALPGLTAREIRVIDRARIVTVGELAALDDETILSWPGCGQQTLNQVRKSLALAGFDRKVLRMINVALLICCAYATAVYDHGAMLFLEM
jgi:hypothetical protein